MKSESRSRLQSSVIKWSVFFIGLMIMAFGIVLMIKADIGVAPWDVLHIGLYKQFGLTIGTWSIIIGFLVLFSTSVLSKSWPQIGAFLNMLLVGVFIDLFMLLPFITTPYHLVGRIVMLIAGVAIIGYGIGVYISAKRGAGPRDTLMLVLTEKTGWKVSRTRLGMEVIVLSVGFLLGGPVSLGTFLFGFTIGPIVGVTLPHCEKIMEKFLRVSNTTIQAEMTISK
ncbi:YczE/YyaS/YitT family protein [Bacillus suaedaesalsae]|uniref:YitT family protein n=1 Tax=Bacillus suaedaesalsae TaxID=2810349 RepID=A0ABS2DML0_9BACI|nr:YitT family protein [Bacillus suaedaesalsae]MBM6619698.1 YitT family protein [Bacillus suaedaesalsae]